MTNTRSVHLAVKVNQMCEGLNVAPVVLTDNPMLSSVSPHQLQQQQQTDYRASSSASSSASGSYMSTAGRASSRQMSSAGIEGRITQLIGQAREDDIAILLRSSSLDDINRISPDTWELMVPVALSWSQHHGSEQATMSYSVMYHIMDNCASVLARPSIRNYVRRFAAACENAWHTGKDMAHAGGLSLAELGTLTSYLKQH